MPRRRRLIARTSAPRWAGVRVLQVAHRLNEQCIAALAEPANSDPQALSSHLPAELSALWRELDERACTLAARCPLLLVDLNFTSRDWWGRAAKGALASTPQTFGGGFLRPDLARDIVREVLIETWSASRSMPQAVSLIFGMTPEVCTTIAALRVSVIDRIVLEHAHALRPRWSENVKFWRGLLEGSIADDQATLTETHLYALQLLGGVLMAHREVSTAAHGFAGSA